MANIFRKPVKGARVKKSSRRYRHSALYESYMQSDEWRILRQRIIDIVGGLCERCEATEDDVTLEVHHLTYERLGHEDLEDLQVLCPPCHVIADAERASETRSNLEYRRLDGWATKVYGSDWESRSDVSDIEDAFNEWVEARS